MPYFILILLNTLFLAPFNTFASEGVIPKAATTLSEDIHTQLLQHIGGSVGYRHPKISIILTTPVLLDDLTKTNTLAKQLAEELMYHFVKLGYRVQEVRKGEEIIINPKTGERILTRNQTQLSKKAVTSEAILAGTYTITNESIRFNIQLLHTPTNDVLAMSSTSIPITKEIFPLLKSSEESGPPKPSVQTKFH